ncbi:MAG: hypothetical protein GX089_17225, partial [Fibrobacter sp.]|nr:hypothetical protein [Fibrobacter sp.]
MNKSDSFKAIIESSECGPFRARFTSRDRYFSKKFKNLYYIENDIFHYTDLHGLLGIIESGGFWLSEAKYLNDSEELVNGVKISKTLIEKLLLKKRYGTFSKLLEVVYYKLGTLKFNDN